MTQKSLMQRRCWKRRDRAAESGTFNITNLQLAKCRFGMQFNRVNDVGRSFPRSIRAGGCVARMTDARLDILNRWLRSDFRSRSGDSHASPAALIGKRGRRDTCVDGAMRYRYAATRKLNERTGALLNGYTRRENADARVGRRHDKGEMAHTSLGTHDARPGWSSVKRRNAGRVPVGL
jgi:hypothetical protein